MKTFRFLIGLPFLLGAILLALFSLWQFGTGLFTWSAGPVFLGLAVMVGSIAFFIITGVIMPKPEPVHATASAVATTAKKA